MEFSFKFLWCLEVNQKMSLLLLVVLITFFDQSFPQELEETVDLTENGIYTWEGLNSGSTAMNITAQNYTISVHIETCDIGNAQTRPNNEYLILKNGNDNPLSEDNGRIFAYIKKPKSYYFFSSSVILQLMTPTVLTKKCTVTFEKGDMEDSTLPPVTTTEAAVTGDPETSKYSTVLISGHSMEELNQNRNLIQELKDDIAAMAEEYTEIEGFCLKRKIKSEDIDIYTLEQCPTQWPDFENCVRLVYALPVKIDSSCTLWKDYQLTEEHLDLMWSRLATKYLKNFSVYNQTEINSVITWWITCLMLVIFVFAISLILINFIWRRRFIEGAHVLKNGDYIADTRKISEISLTPPYFQPIPPMFGKTDGSDEPNGVDNEGFRCDTSDMNENITTI